MTSRRSRIAKTLAARSLVASLPLACILLTAAALAPRPAAADDWVTFVDETSTRLVSDPSIGVNDVEEKDIATGDVDQDGDTDVVVVRKQPFTNPGGFRNVLFMNENGVMTDRTATLAPDFLAATNDRDVELADVDGDGWLDIITAGTFEEQPRILMNLGEVSGVWQGFQYDASRIPTLQSGAGYGPFFCGMGVGDLTGDGRPEIYFTDYGGLVINLTDPPGESKDLDDRLLINNGSGRFTDQTATRLPAGVSVSTFGTDTDIADVNGDGWNDIIKNDSTGFTGPTSPEHTVVGDSPDGTLPNPAVTVFYNDGTANPGHFSTFDSVYLDAPYMVAAADFTQDAKLDLFVVDDGSDNYLVNTGNDGQGHAQFTAHPVGGTVGFGGNVVFADLDGNGVLDVLVADVDTDIPGCNDRRLIALQGLGAPPNVTYSDTLGARPWTPNGTFDVAALYINDDSALDLWLGTCTGTKIFMGVSHDIFLDGFESGDTSAWDTTLP